jgi:hypothetical protein
MKGPTIGCRMILLALLVLVLAGCVHNPGWRSAYQAAYADLLAGVEVPTDADIRAVSVRDERLAQPAAKIWETCLTLAGQSWSLLGVGDDPGGGHRALLAAYHSAGGSGFLVDRWLAVSVQPLDERLSRVSIAFVSPETARVGSLAGDRPPARVHIGKGRSLGLAASTDLLLAIERSFAEPAYLGRLGDAGPGIIRGPAMSPQVENDPAGDLRAERHGNYTSARFRRESFILDFPELGRRITAVAHRIAVAAGHPGTEIRVYFVADRELNPHIEANGDLFLSTGTLDTVANMDELAGIIAHEMAHLYLHHGRTRMSGVHAAAYSQMTLMLAGGTAGDYYGVIRPQLNQVHNINPVTCDITTCKKNYQAKDLPGIVTPGSALSGAVVELAVIYGSVYVGALAGTGVARAEIHEFSQSEELAADDYGTELLWRAGFDYHALLTLLQRAGHQLGPQR